MRSKLPKPASLNGTTIPTFNATSTTIICFTKDNVLSRFTISIQNTSLANTNHMSATQCVISSVAA